MEGSMIDLSKYRFDNAFTPGGTVMRKYIERYLHWNV